MWDYPRETSVYVVFCLLIVAFIFFTPKSWFAKPERVTTKTPSQAVKDSGLSPIR